MEGPEFIHPTPPCIMLALPPETIKLEFRLTGEERPPRKGEWFTTAFGHPPDKATWDYDDPHLILERVTS